jgi:hypothetical protein
MVFRSVLWWFVVVREIWADESNPRYRRRRNLWQSWGDTMSY